MRQVHFAWNLEGIKGSRHPRLLQSFHQPNSVHEDLKLLSDKDIGGFSNARIEWVAPCQENWNGFLRFSGDISTRLPPDDPAIMRSGYAAFRTHDMPPTLFGKSLWNIDPYAFLAMRIKSDGRSYLVNLQTDGLVPTDIHQHRLFATRPGEWETVIFKWNDFVRTNHGFPVEPQSELLRQKVKSIGIGLTDRVEGPFEICVEKIWATNEYDGVGIEPLPEHGRKNIEDLLQNEQEKIKHQDAANITPSAAAINSKTTTNSESILRNKKGERIFWQNDGKLSEWESRWKSNRDKIVWPSWPKEEERRSNSGRPRTSGTKL